MKRFLLLLLLAFAMWELQAQIPYFASTAGDGKLYGYTSLKLRPGINTQETYTTFQYGIGNSVALGTDIYTGVGSNYMGFLARYGVSLSKWFNVGAQFTPSFNLSHNFEFGYLTSALYLNGNISRDGSWFWCANTWWGVNSGSNVKNTIDQWLYVGHTCKLLLKCINSLCCSRRKAGRSLLLRFCRQSLSLYYSLTLIRTYFLRYFMISAYIPVSL